ncbi:glycolate oxidase subunit GlcF [Phenylobacterium sp. LjRoot225]|uniref:glycolate oxidase subunit GlcF n=1 Tax=Phenylobacterium sp. LjRoot225 TaxID=3342285 RepID=UPI003ECC2A17
MRTSFTDAQRRDPEVAASEAEIRRCVHCGFCTATCPTYVLLGDELDSPRGRIYLIKDMLENERRPTPEVVTHIDRCLSCLSCVTTCPSGVDYRRLIDHARTYVERNHRRPWPERALRWGLAHILPYPHRLRLALRLARPIRGLAGPLGRAPGLKSVAAMLRLAPAQEPAPAPAKATPAIGERRGRVILLQGCAESVLTPEVRSAAVRLLTKAGYDASFAAGEGCCGALVHHMGRHEAALVAARRNIDAWSRAAENGPVAAIVVTASGCGSAVKDYGHLLRDDSAYAERAAAFAAIAKDVTEVLDGALPQPVRRTDLAVALHSACSLNHGQRVRVEPARLLAVAGFQVLSPAEAHLCCGSAGVYNILQPDIAGHLGRRKAANLDGLRADVIASGNIGCATQIGGLAKTPVAHTVELLDWAMGGPAPSALAHLPATERHQTNA